MNIAQLIKNLIQLTTTKIIEHVNKEFDGKEKKTRVDAAITTWVTDNIVKLGTVQKFIITQYIIPIIPVITQAIYDCLKQKVEGITANG